MKRAVMLLVAVGLAAIVAMAARRTSREERDVSGAGASAETPAGSVDVEVARDPALAAGSEPARAARREAPKPPPASDVSERETPEVRVAPERTLAVVNGRALAARDLVAPPDDGSPLVVSERKLRLLLERAIRRELVLDEARARGIELSPAARAELEVARAERLAGEPDAIAIVGRLPAQVELDLREAEALMLEAEMLAREGWSPHVTAADLEVYYAEHPEALDALSPEPAERAAQEATIRASLAAAKREQWRQAGDALVARLRAAARVEAMSH